MNHKHVPAKLTQAGALGTCSSLELQECNCGAFRLPAMERWVKPYSMPKPPDFTITSAARFLRISARTLERLLALAGVELELVH